MDKTEICCTVPILLVHFPVMFVFFISKLSSYLYFLTFGSVIGNAMQLACCIDNVLENSLDVKNKETV